MTNIDKAAQVIDTWTQDNTITAYTGNPHDLAQALADAGLFTPELPEPNDPGIFALNGKGWLPGGPDGPSVWTAPGSPIMVQRIEPGDLTPEEARGVAYALLAAADYAEEA